MDLKAAFEPKWCWQQEFAEKIQVQTVATNACHPGSKKLPEKLYETSQTSTGLWITAAYWRYTLASSKATRGWVRWRKETSRQEKHCWQVKERQAKANPRRELKGNLKGKTVSPQVRQTAAVQYTAPGSLQLSYQNMGGEGLWLYTPSVWQGRRISPSFPAHFNALKTLLNASSENTSEFLKVSLPCYNRGGIKGFKSY